MHDGMMTMSSTTASVSVDYGNSGTSSSIVDKRIAALEEQAASSNNNAQDHSLLPLKNLVSYRSNTKRYNFCDGLQRDLDATRQALVECCGGRGRGRGVDSHSHHHGQQRCRCNRCCSFATLFTFTQGRIANLNRVLQNLKREGEIEFQSEFFLMGNNNTYREEIVLLPPFFVGSRVETNSNSNSSNDDDGGTAGVYSVTPNNVFHNRACLRQEQSTVVRPRTKSARQRKGRSYEEEEVATHDCHTCSTCQQSIILTTHTQDQRIAVRGHVYHLHCLKCAVCGTALRRKLVFMTFDGRVCCSFECMRNYDGAQCPSRPKIKD